MTNELDSRLRDALAPPEGVASRVAGRALATGPRQAPARRPLWVVLALTLVLVTVLAVYESGPGSSEPGERPPLTITNRHGVVTAVAPWGEAWIVRGGAEEMRSRAGGVIHLEGEDPQ